MTIQEAIHTAIGYETKVHEVYRGTLDKIQDPAGKHIFQVLADEEKGHLDYLNHKIEQLRQTGAVSAGPLATAVPARDKLAAAAKAFQQKIARVDSSSDLKLLQQALDVELETSRFYAGVLGQLPPEGQQFFARFVEIEEGHVAIVQAQIDHISQTGFWFDCLEVDFDAE